MSELELEAPPIELVPIGELDPHPENPNRGDVGVVADLIVHNGWFGGVLAQRRAGERDRIFVGEHRWRALTFLQAQGGTVRERGHEEHLSYDDLRERAEILELPGLPPGGLTTVQRFEISDELALRHMLADNRAHDLATYDEGVLARLLEDLAGDAGLPGTGFEDDDLDHLLWKLKFEDSLDTTNQTKTPGDRAEDYVNAGIRSVILPLSSPLYDELLGHFAALRSAWAVDSNAELVMRMARTARATL